MQFLCNKNKTNQIQFAIDKNLNPFFDTNIFFEYLQFLRDKSI